MLQVEDVLSITKANTWQKPGYYINFANGRSLNLVKVQAIPFILVLIKYCELTSGDLTEYSNKVRIVEYILKEKIPSYLSNSFHTEKNDCKKLLAQEGFTFIYDGLADDHYALQPEDHEKLLTTPKKAFREAPRVAAMTKIMALQKDRCNLCGSKITSSNLVKPTTFWQERRLRVFDYRLPVIKGGNDLLGNFQGLCSACAEMKHHLCVICTIPGCDSNCALRNPERSTLIAPTREDISDLVADRSLFQSTQNVQSD